MKKQWRYLMVWLVLLVWSGIAQGDDAVLFRDDFHHLDNWEPFHFRGIERHTSYEIDEQDAAPVLVAVSDAGASALISKERFSVEHYPIIHWRWKVDNVYTAGNYRRKAGDDYPMRVYVIFEYDPQAADLGTKIKYGLARTLYGQYPPHSSVNYIWANRAEEQETVANPYTDRAMMIPLRYGTEHVGRWVEETVNVYEDYRRVFGEPPPPVASLAIMNDSDDTGEAATSYLDFIEIRQQ